jgi:hypothetical protein
VNSPMQQPRRGRGLVIAGTVMIAVSLLGGIIATAVAANRFDLRDLDRDVAVDGPRERLIPGEIPFRVIAPLNDDGSSEITVGIAVERLTSPRPQCSIQSAAGDPVEWGRARADDALLDDRGDYELVGTARLGPGEYVASCVPAGADDEEVGGFDANFTVGRVFGIDDFSTFIGPLVGVLAVFGVASLLFIVGLVLLIVGLVQRSRSKRAGASTPYGYPGPMPPGYGPQGPYGQPGGSGPYGYPPPPSGYGPYGQQPPSQPGPPAAPWHGAPGDPGAAGPVQDAGVPPWPGPHAPGPPPQYSPDHRIPSSPPAPDQASGEYAHPPSTPTEADDTGRPDPPSGWTIPPSKH